MDSNQDKQQYSYRDAGFSSFMRRSIDSPLSFADNLPAYARQATQQNRSINFDQQPVSGNVAGTFTVGSSIELDSDKVQIRVRDGQTVPIIIGKTENDR